MTRSAGVLAAATVLQHVPDMVRFGSKPSREPEHLAAAADRYRSFAEAVAYPPHQVFVGNFPPERLWDLERPWWTAAVGSDAGGPFGEIIPQHDFLERLVAADRFDIIRLGDRPDPTRGDLALVAGGETVGAVASADADDLALRAGVLLENLACKASGAHALGFMLEANDLDPDSIDYVLSAGEEAVGDRYQRGGGSMSKAIAEACGLGRATGGDVKAFCAGPVHALVMASALVASGTFDRVVVVAGGSLAKLGMKFLGAVEAGAPILEDVLAAVAVLVGPADGNAVRLDAVGTHRIRSGSSQEALLTDILSRPLQTMGRTITDIDKYATELHDPDITEPAGSGDVPLRNYRMMAALGRLTGELDAGGMESFPRIHGLPGFAPTQGHIASAVPWIPHAVRRFAEGSLRTTMLLAKGSLFLGRVTRMWDGVSITLET